MVWVLCLGLGLGAVSFYLYYKLQETLDETIENDEWDA
jgi:hypothetical protein